MSILIASLIVLGEASGSAPLEALGRFDASAIPEASGIVKSRRFPDIFWVHNDSGNPPLLFAVRRDGRIVRQFRLAVPNIDWEDIAIDDGGHLYLGDIGNNGGLLPLRVIYRIDEPDPSSPGDRTLTATASTFYALPANNRFDAESLIYDCGTAVIVAKYFDGREAELFAIALEPPAPLARPTKPRLIGRLPGFREPATGADLSADNTLLAVSSETVTRIYRRNESQPWRLVAEVRYQPLPVEGIAWDGRDLILAAEEGRGLYRLSEKTWRAAARTQPQARPPRAIERRARSDSASVKEK
jgi:hypothetical protein